jgi:hypothetical protein
MLIPIFALLVMVAGMLIYALADKNPKVAEIGRIMIFCGMLVVVASSASGKMIKIL